MRKKGPVFIGEAGAPGSAPVASFEVKQKTYGATLHRENLVPGQAVSLPGDRRRIGLRVVSKDDAGNDFESVWYMTGKAERKKTKRAVGEHRRNGVLVSREEVEVTSKRGAHTVTIFGKKRTTVRRHIVRGNLDRVDTVTRKHRGKAKAKAKRGRR